MGRMATWRRLQLPAFAAVVSLIVLAVSNAHAAGEPDRLACARRQIVGANKL